MTSREETDNSTSTILNLENFEYTTTGLLRQYHRSVNNGSSANTRHWYYRYSLGGAREQKRMSDDVLSGGVSSPAPDGEATWVYYALGVDRRQYAVHHAIKTQYTNCGYTSDPHVYFYPIEYLSYGAGDAATIVMKRDANDIWHKEYKVQDQLGSTRVIMDDNGTVTGQYNYEPFGAPLSGAGTEPRLSYIDREKDKESELGDFGVRKYDYEYGRFMSIDPLWEKYPDLSPYQYSLNQPIRYKDNNGKEVQLTGTLKEVEKLIRDIEYASGSILTYTSVKEKNDLYTLTLTGYKSVDSRFHKQQAYLDELIKDDMIITVQYGNAGLHGGGSYDDKTQTVTIDRKLMNKNSTSFFYWNVSERRDFWGRYLGFNKNTVVYRDAWDTMAHELFGHAYDHITGALLTMDKEMAEIKAVWRENEVQELRGKLPRNAEQPSLWITPWD